MADSPTTGNDVIVGTSASETINALAGSDEVYGIGGQQHLARRLRQ